MGNICCVGVAHHLNYSEASRRLTDFDQVSVWVAEVAAPFPRMKFRLGDEMSALQKKGNL